MKYTVRYGILLGIVSIFTLLVCYLIDYKLLVYQADIALFFVTFLMLIHAGLQLRKKRHGELSFFDAFIHSFFVMLISGLVYSFFKFVLFDMIDPALGENLKEATLQQTIQVLDHFNASEDFIDSVIEDLKVEETFGTSQIYHDYFTRSVYLGGGLALIVALIVKKKNHVYH